MSVVSHRQAAAGSAIAAIRPHPNEFDRRRIEAALKRRRRYRYVEPSVVVEEGGYRIESACCSRTIDPEGGVVDIARIGWSAEGESWTLSWRDRRVGEWAVDLVAPRLDMLLDRLLADEDRRFWQ